MDNWSEFSDAWQPDAELSEGAKALRDQFVTEYLKDTNAYLAAIRCGFVATFAIEWAKRLMGEPYVQRLIQQLTEPDTNDEVQAKKDFEMNAQRLRQVRDDPGSKPMERAAAIRELNAMRGFNKPTGSESDESVLIDALREFAAKAPA